jgi:probable lipoprotein NlpC
LSNRLVIPADAGIHYEDLLAVPWKQGGRSLSGLDCYGLVKELFSRLGRDLPEIDPTPEAVADLDGLIIPACLELGEKIDNPEAYCVVVFAMHPPWVSHMGVVLPENKFIHALRRRTVQVNRLNDPYWQGKIAGYYRYRDVIPAPRSVIPAKAGI